MRNNVNIDQISDYQMAALAEQLNNIEPGSGAPVSANILEAGLANISELPFSVDPLLVAVPIVLALGISAFMLLKLKDFTL